MNFETILKYISASFMVAGLAKGYVGYKQYQQEGEQRICSADKKGDLEMVLESNRVAEYCLPGIGFASVGLISYGSLIAWDILDRSRRVQKKDYSKSPKY